MATPSEQAAGTVELVSTSPGGKPANAESNEAEVSADGSVVVYQSGATNLTHDPQNATVDVFLWDRASDRTIQVSQGLSGTAPNGGSYAAAVTADGSFVTFTSNASNLVPGDTNGAADIFVYESATREVSRVSVGPDGAQANRDSFFPDISNDGRYVVFGSDATSLVAGDTNRNTDIFLVDRSTDLTTRVSVGQDGEQLDAGSNFPAISGDGEFIVLQSGAESVVPGDQNGHFDILRYARDGGAVELMSATPQGTSGHGDSTKPTISDDGRYVAFESRAPDLVSDDGENNNDVFVRDGVAQETTLVNRQPGGKVARGRAAYPAISGDGAHVTYHSDADDLVPTDPKNNTNNVFLTDRNTGVTTLVSHLPNGKPPVHGAWEGPIGISYDGNYVSFDHHSKQLIKGLRVRQPSVYLFTANP